MEITGAVVLCQIVILLLIYVSASWSGLFRGLTILGTILWNLTHVYLLPLMIIHFFNIQIAVNVSKTNNKIINVIEK